MEGGEPAAASHPSADRAESAAGSPGESAVDDQTRSPSEDKDDDHDCEDGDLHDRERVQSADPEDPDDLKRKIIRQVEYYFSDENLPTDNHLLGLIKKNKEGFVPIWAIASFRKMKKLTQDLTTIVNALKESSFLTVSTDGKKVKRSQPLLCDVRDEKLFTVLVENLPEDHSMSNLERMFGEVGKIRKICIHDPNSAEVSKKAGKLDKYLVGKLHALIEYETVEAAEKAVATLHNEADWRNGMRVKLLKRVGQKKMWKAPDSEKNGAGHALDQARGDQDYDSSQHNDHLTVEEDVEAIPKEKIEEGGRNHGRSRRHKHRGGMNGYGHGTTTSSHNVEVSKPPPGPKMPDGTRGFTMGRGRPLVLDHS